MVAISKKNLGVVANSSKLVSKNTVPHHAGSTELSTAPSVVLVLSFSLCDRFEIGVSNEREARTLRETGALSQLAEASDACAAMSVSQTNFLDHVGKGPGYFGTFFNAILRTPARRQNEDLRHVVAAWDCLAPGGTLVAVLSSGWECPGNETELLLFQRWFATVHARQEELSEDTFIESAPPMQFRLVWTVGQSVNPLSLTRVIERPTGNQFSRHADDITAVKLSLRRPPGAGRSGAFSARFF
jgi:hypothetical protein